MGRNTLLAKYQKDGMTKVVALPEHTLIHSIKQQKQLVVNDNKVT